MRPSTIIFSLLPVLAVGSPTYQQLHTQPDWPSLASLLARVDNGVLHSVLHQLSPKYTDGIFYEDRSALEQVHSSDPVVATKLVHMALKRQNNGTTTTTTSEQTTTTPTSIIESTPSTTPSSESTMSSPSTSSSDSSEASSISSALSADITATTTPDPTTIAVAPTSPENAVPVTTVGGGVVYSTIGGGIFTETSRNVAVSFTPSSSTRLITSTGANGQVKTLTSVVVVNAPVTGGAEDAAGAAATSGPGLQDAAGLVVVNSAAVWLAALAAAGVAAAAFAL